LNFLTSFFSQFLISDQVPQTEWKKVNLSTPRPEGWGLLEVHPEPHFFTPLLKAGLRAPEWVKKWN